MLPRIRIVPRSTSEPGSMTFMAEWNLHESEFKQLTNNSHSHSSHKLHKQLPFGRGNGDRTGSLHSNHWLYQDNQVFIIFKCALLYCNSFFFFGGTPYNTKSLVRKIRYCLLSMQRWFFAFADPLWPCIKVKVKVMSIINCASISLP